MRYAGPLRRRGLRGADVHAPVHQHRVDRADLGAEGLGERDGGLGLARLPWGPRAPSSGGALTAHRLRRRRRPAPDDAPRQMVRGGVGDPRVDERARDPGHRAGARSGSSGSAPASSGPSCRPPSTSTSNVRADLRASVLDRDALLQRDEPVEPLLHDRLGHLVVEAGRPRARPWRVLEHEGAVEPRLLHHLERSAKSSSVSPGNPTMMSVETAMSGIAERMRSSQPR